MRQCKQNCLHTLVLACGCQSVLLLHSRSAAGEPRACRYQSIDGYLRL